MHRTASLLCAAAAFAAPAPVYRTPKASGVGHDAKVFKAKLEALVMQLHLEVYKLKNGHFPQTLKALAEKQPDGGPPLVPKGRLHDPWGRPYQYNANGPRNGGLKPDVWSEGPDPKQKDAIIGNWPRSGSKK